MRGVSWESRAGEVRPTPDQITDTVLRMESLSWSWTRGR